MPQTNQTKPLKMWAVKNEYGIDRTTLSIDRKEAGKSACERSGFRDKQCSECQQWKKSRNKTWRVVRVLVQEIQ